MKRDFHFKKGFCLCRFLSWLLQSCTEGSTSTAHTYDDTTCVHPQMYSSPSSNCHLLENKNLVKDLRNRQINSTRARRNQAYLYCTTVTTPKWIHRAETNWFGAHYSLTPAVQIPFGGGILNSSPYHIKNNSHSSVTCVPHLKMERVQVER